MSLRKKGVEAKVEIRSLFNVPHFLILCFNINSISANKKEVLEEEKKEIGFILKTIQKNSNITTVMFFCLCHETDLKLTKAKGGLRAANILFSFLQYLLNAKKKKEGKNGLRFLFYECIHNKFQKKKKKSLIFKMEKNHYHSNSTIIFLFLFFLHIIFFFFCF